MRAKEYNERQMREFRKAVDEFVQECLTYKATNTYLIEAIEGFGSWIMRLTLLGAITSTERQQYAEAFHMMAVESWQDR